MPNDRWKRFKSITPRKTAAFLGFVVTGVLAVALGVWTWKHFAPHEPVAAWTFVAGVGTLATAVGTIGLAFVGLRGLRSLAITRDEIIHRAVREARLCAIERLEEAANELVPLNTGILDSMVDNKVGAFLQGGAPVTFNPDPKDIRHAIAWRNGLSTEVYNKIVNFLNHLEAWSVYFTKGVADDEVAFGPVAPLLRSWVGQYYAVLLSLRSTPGTSGNFPNLVELYGAWSARMDAEQLARQQQDVLAQIEQAKSRQKKLTPSTPRIADT